MSRVILNTIPQTVPSYHPAVGRQLDKVWREYSISRVEWRNGNVTFHLNSCRVTGGIRDPWDNNQWGVTDSRKIAESLGINWDAACTLV